MKRELFIVGADPTHMIDIEEGAVQLDDPGNICDKMHPENYR